MSFRVSNDFWYERNILLSNRSRIKNDKFPWHASISESLELELFADPDYMVQFGDALTVHPPDELPMMLPKENIFEFGNSRSLEVLITPSVIRSDENLRSLAPTDRSCYFEGEKNLRFFKIYTKQNCLIDCFSNLMRQTCDCVPFDVVREPDTKVCGYAGNDSSCQYAMEKDFKDYRPTGKLASCSCLSLCDTISYDIEIRESRLQGIE